MYRNVFFFPVHHSSSSIRRFIGIKPASFYRSLTTSPAVHLAGTSRQLRFALASPFHSNAHFIPLLLHAWRSPILSAWRI